MLTDKQTHTGLYNIDLKAVHNWNSIFDYFSFNKFLVLFGCCQLVLSQKSTKQAMKKNWSKTLNHWFNYERTLVTRQQKRGRVLISFPIFFHVFLSILTSSFHRQFVKREWTPKRVKNELANSTVCMCVWTVSSLANIYFLPNKLSGS